MHRFARFLIIMCLALSGCATYSGKSLPPEHTSCFDNIQGQHGLKIAAIGLLSILALYLFIRFLMWVIKKLEEK